MSRAFKYTLLIASLPHHPHDLLSAKQPPISEIQLEKRLQLLTPEDRAQLDSIEKVIFWSHVRDVPEAEIIAQDNAVLAAIRNPFLKELLLWRLSLRTLMSALRLRHQGFKPGPGKAFLGFGKWPAVIGKHWDHPRFGISPVDAPWLTAANELIGQNRTLELEKLLLHLSWRHYTDLSVRHLFDFEAVVLYVLRWDVINRWSQYYREHINESALSHFMQLVENGLSMCPSQFDQQTLEK